MEGLGCMLAKKFYSNSLASRLKDKMEAGCSRLNHIHVGPLSLVGNARHNKALEMS